jgi:hypothetical protein
MRLSLRNNLCAVDIVNPGKPPAGRDFNYNYKFDVTGTNCPVSQVADAQILLQTANRIYGGVHVRYSVNDATYSGYNDVTALEFDDSLEGLFSFPRGGTSIVGKGKGSGFITSQTLGRIDIKTVSAVDIMSEQAGFRGGIEQLTTLDFQTFGVILRSKRFYSGKNVVSHFYLNGIEISVENFKRYTKYLSLTDAERYGFID